MNPVRTVAVIGAMEAEVALLKSSLNNTETHQYGRAFTVYTGQIGNKNIVLCQSGIGKVNAAIATTLVIGRFAPDCVINTGSAGGLGSGLTIGDVVIGSETAHHDVDVTAFGYVSGQVPQLPARFPGHDALIAAAEQAAAVFQAATVCRGLIVSGDRFIADKTVQLGILDRFPDAQAVEMEAAAIAQTCHQFGIPCVVVRAVSDSASEQAHISFDQFLETAAKHSAQMVLALAEAL